MSLEGVSCQAEQPASHTSSTLDQVEGEERTLRGVKRSTEDVWFFVSLDTLKEKKRDYAGSDVTLHNSGRGHKVTR